MHIHIVTPAPPGSRKGNRVTAERWAGLLRELHHTVAITGVWTDELCDVLVALHARRSADSIARFADARPGTPLILALTGTDLYGDIHTDASAQRSLELATRFVTLQPAGIAELPAGLRHKARAIFQSVSVPGTPPPPRDPDHFDVVVLGHMRPVKDPFRAAHATRQLPADSRIRITHIGAALSPEMEQQALAEQASNPRYRWLGEMPRDEALCHLQAGRLLVLTSISEGGANVVSEAIAVGIPVLSTRIAGSIGMLGDRYPGYFAVGDTPALTGLLLRVERDPAFLADLTGWCDALAPMVDPARERESWHELLADVTPKGA